MMIEEKGLGAREEVDERCFDSLLYERLRQRLPYLDYARHKSGQVAQQPKQGSQCRAGRSAVFSLGASLSLWEKGRR
jgi:hypothetical protein